MPAAPHQPAQPLWPVALKFLSLMAGVVVLSVIAAVDLVLMLNGG